MSLFTVYRERVNSSGLEGFRGPFVKVCAGSLLLRQGSRLKSNSRVPSSRPWPHQPASTITSDISGAIGTSRKPAHHEKRGPSISRAKIQGSGIWTKLGRKDQYKVWEVADRISIMHVTGARWVLTRRIDEDINLPRDSKSVGLHATSSKLKASTIEDSCGSTGRSHPGLLLHHLSRACL